MEIIRARNPPKLNGLIRLLKRNMDITGLRKLGLVGTFIREYQRLTGTHPWNNLSGQRLLLGLELLTFTDSTDHADTLSAGGTLLAGSLHLGHHARTNHHHLRLCTGTTAAGA
jgi:hypothetical protein